MLVRLTTRLVLASLTAMTGKGDPLFLFSTFDAPQALGFTVATGINNSGQVVGYFSGSNGYRGFLYAQNQFTVLNVPMAGAPASQYAGGINDLGQIVGFYDPQGGGGGFLRGFLYSGGAYSDVVPPLADGGVHVNGISDGQQIVGDYSRERVTGSLPKAEHTLPWTILRQCTLSRMESISLA